jgi:hypothetical protein
VYEDTVYIQTPNTVKIDNQTLSKNTDTKDTITKDNIQKTLIYNKGEKSKDKVTVKKNRVDIPEYIDNQTWLDFLDMRKKIKKPPTDSAKEILIKKLIEYHDKGEDVNKILEQSIVNCWQGLFPLKTNHNGYSNRRYEQEEANVKFTE